VFSSQIERSEVEPQVPPLRFHGKPDPCLDVGPCFMDVVALGLHFSFRKPDSTWTVPVSLGPKINDGLAHRWAAYVTPDGKYLFYTRGSSAKDSAIYWVRFDTLLESVGRRPVSRWPAVKRDRENRESLRLWAGNADHPTDAEFVCTHPKQR
jgi:hypothetical protein